MGDVRDRSLEQLEQSNRLIEGESYLNSEMRRLLRLPLRQLRLEDLRLLIGQGVGHRFLVPIALEHVEAHPLAAGDFYPGDLLKHVMEVDETFWTARPELRRRLVAALKCALQRIRRAGAPPELEREFRDGLSKHQAASQVAV